MPHFKPQRVLASLALLASLTVHSGCGASLNRAQESLAVGDEASAEVQLRKALKTKSTRDEAARLLSVLLERKAEKIAADEPKDAEELYREALELDARNEAARLGLARLLMKRGFMEEAKDLLAMKGCHGCGRLVAMMVHQRAENALATGEIMSARQLYQQAFDEGGDPMDALGLVRTYLAPSARDLDKAMETLAAAAPLIAGGQVEAEGLFQDLRIQLLMAAVEARNNEMVEALFDIKTATLQEEPEFDLRFRVSQAQFRNGDSDPAIARMTHLLETSGQYLEPTQRQVMNAALVVMYSARAAQFLQAGDPVGAAKDIGAGLKLDPENSRLKLQQVLAIAANRLPLAMTQVEKLTEGKDRSEVEAILHALETLAYLDEGKMAKAYASLDQAQRLGADLPEVHLARAYVLARSRNEDVKKRDELKDVRQLSGIDYPKNRIYQYPGALANLDRAEDRVREQGVLHPFRGPGFTSRVAALRDEIKAFYPHEVQWYPGKGGMIQITAKDSQETVEYRGPRWLKGSAVASPGFEAEIPVENPGLVYLEHEGKEIAVVVEENTQINIEL